MENTNYPKPEDSTQHSETDELVRKNKILMFALIGLGALLLLGAVLFFTTRDKNPETVNNEGKPAERIDRVILNDSMAKEAETPDNEIKTVEGGEFINEYGEEYEPYSEYRVIANEAFVRTSPNENATALPKRLKFGDKVFVDHSFETVNGYSKVYFERPGQPNTQTAYYVIDFVLAYQSEFEDYKKYFSLKPFAGLAAKTKRLIVNNNYSDSRRYELTQNLERSKSAICYGDFDSDGIQDVAVLMDNNEDQFSRLLIICTNSATKDPYLAYAENYSDKMRINSFKKNAKIFLNSSELVNSPADGVILNASDTKIAMVYDKANQKFNTYFQDYSYDEVYAD